MSHRHGQASPPPPLIPQGHQGRLERLWFAFTREQLTLARFATLAVGVRPGEASSGGKRDRGEGEGEDKEAKEARTELGEGEEEDHDSDDSSGGATTLSPTAEERAAGMIATAKDLLRRAEAPDPDLRETLALRMASLVADVYALLQRRGDDLEAGARRRLRRYVRRLEAAQQELTGDFEMTQMPDDVLGGEGSGVESVDSDDSGEAGASGFGNEDAMEESLIDAAGEGEAELVEEDDLVVEEDDLVDKDGEDGEDDADELDRLVGRAVTLVRGRQQRWFLAVWRDRPVKEAEWLPEADFDTPRRLAMLNEYKRLTGRADDPNADPDGRGWVREVVKHEKRGRGRNRRTVYRVRWFTSEDGVPNTIGLRDEWVFREQLLAPETTLGPLDQGDDRPERDDESDSDAASSDDDDAGPGGDGPGGGGGPLAWDSASGRPKVTVSGAIGSLPAEEPWLLLSLYEWCVWRLYLLQCRAPRQASVSAEDTRQLADDLYEIDRERLDAQLPDGTSQDDHEREQKQLLLQQVQRRWRRRRRQRERDTRLLRGQFLGLKLVRMAREAEAAGRPPPNLPASAADLSVQETQDPSGSQVDEAARRQLGLLDSEENVGVRRDALRIARAQRDGSRWWPEFAHPPARVHSQGNLLSGSKDPGGNRNARQLRYLAWLRDFHTEKEAEYRLPAQAGSASQPRYRSEWLDGDFGSPYSTFWPRGKLATSASVNLEHIVASEWLRTTESVLKEAGLPRQDITVCTLANASENSARGEKPLSCFGTDADLTNSKLYHPDETRSQAKRTRLAKATCHGVLGIPFVQQDTKSLGSKAIAGHFGVPEYARRLAGLRRDATAQSSGIARRIALINSHYHRWHDPLVLRPSLLRQPRYAWMLEMRLRGGHDKDDAATLECGLALLVDHVLRSSVVDAP